MKFMLVILFLIIAALAYLFFAPSDTSSGPQQNSQPTTTQTRQPQRQPTAQPTQQRSGGGSLGAAAAGITTDVGDVMGYGVGATQMRAKKRSQEKLDNLNSTHNKDLNERLSK